MALATLTIENVDVILKLGSTLETLGNVGTFFAAIAAVWAANSAQTSAKAAESSANQWQEQVAFNLLLEKTSSCCSKLTWLLGAIHQPCSVNLDHRLGQTLTTKQITSLLQGTAPELVRKQEALKKYFKLVESNHVKIKELSDECFYLLEEAFLLSEHISKTTKKEKDAVSKMLHDFIYKIRVIANIFDKVGTEELNEIDVDACFKFSEGSQHYYLDLKAEAELIMAYLHYVSTPIDSQSWKASKQNYINHKKAHMSRLTSSNMQLREAFNKYAEELFD